MYIQDRNSQLVFEYINTANPQYEVVIEKPTSGKPTQQWLVTDSGVAGYVYIQSVYDGNVISVGDDKHDTLTVYPKKEGVNLNQLWILRPPDMDQNNQNFVLMSAKTGYVMDVKSGNKTPGTPIQLYDRNNKYHQQFRFYQYFN